MTHPGSLTPDELDEKARDMDRAVIMAEVRAAHASGKAKIADERTRRIIEKIEEELR
jgi:hypothetical protein